MRINTRLIFPLPVLAAFLWGGFVWAESDQKVFKINGKDVPPVVATVNGTSFSADFLRNQMMAVQSLAEQQGQKITPEEEEQYARGILITAIEKELIFQKGKGLNIQVDPKTIQRQINHIRNQFPSNKMFLTALAYQHMTLRDLETRIEKELIEDEFVRREISSKIHVEDQAVTDFYNKNKSAFIEPDEYEVSHIFTETIQQGEANIEDERMRKKAKRMTDMINSEARETILTVARKLKAGDKFEDLAKQYSEDESTKNDGGRLGRITLQNASPLFASNLTKLKVGQTSRILESTQGYHILKLIAKYPGKPIPLEKAKSDILNILLKEESEKRKKEYISKIKKTADIDIFL